MGLPTPADPHWQAMIFHACASKCLKLWFLMGKTIPNCFKNKNYQRPKNTQQTSRWELKRSRSNNRPKALGGCWRRGARDDSMGQTLKKQPYFWMKRQPLPFLFWMFNHAEFWTIGFQNQFEVPPTSGQHIKSWWLHVQRFVVEIVNPTINDAQFHRPHRDWDLNHRV